MIYLYDQRMKALIGKEIDTLSEQLSSGHAASFEEYKFKVGILRGLRMALQSVDELAISMKDQ